MMVLIEITTTSAGLFLRLTIVLLLLPATGSLESKRISCIFVVFYSSYSSLFVLYVPICHVRPIRLNMNCV